MKIKIIRLLVLSLFFGAVLYNGTPGDNDVGRLSWAAENRSGSGADLEEMKEFYMEECRSCHGDTGRGDGRLTRILSASVGDLADPEMWERTDEELVEMICRGKKPMPAYKSSLGQEGCRAMVEYVRTLAPKP